MEGNQGVHVCVHRASSRPSQPACLPLFNPACSLASSVSPLAQARCPGCRSCCSLEARVPRRQRPPAWLSWRLWGRRCSSRYGTLARCSCCRACSARVGELCWCACLHACSAPACSWACLPAGEQAGALACQPAACPVCLPACLVPPTSSVPRLSLAIQTASPSTNLHSFPTRRTWRCCQLWPVRPAHPTPCPLPLLQLSADVVEVAMASTEALRSLEVNSSRDTSRSTSSHPAGSSGAGAATAAAAAAAIAAVSGRPAAKGGAATAAPAAGPSGVAAGGIEAAASPAGGPTFNKLGSWGRRGSQTISLEQMPPEVATAEAAAAVATVTAAPPPPAVPRGAVSPLSPPPGLPRPPQSPTLKPPPLPPSAQSVQPHVQSVPLSTSPFAVGQMPPPAFME